MTRKRLLLVLDMLSLVFSFMAMRESLKRTAYIKKLERENTVLEKDALFYYEQTNKLEDTLLNCLDIVYGFSRPMTKTEKIQTIEQIIKDAVFDFKFESTEKVTER